MPARPLRADFARPGPVSRTCSTQEIRITLRARIVSTPAPAVAAMPCWIAFSTSGCRIRLGTRRLPAAGSISHFTCRRSPSRICSISTYPRTKASSSASGTSCNVGGLQHLPQQLAQAHDQLFGQFRIAVNQLGDRMQRVEEKMRIELAAQGLQLRLVQQRLELDRLQLPVARFAVVGSRMPGQHEARVDG